MKLGIVAGAAVALMSTMADSRIALADDTTAATPTTSSTQSKSLMDTLADHYALTYWGNYYGPSISQPNNLNPAPVNGYPATAQYLDSLVTFSYKLNQNLLLGVAQEFYYRPVIGQDLTLIDPAVRLQALHVIHNDSFDLKLEGWAYAPVTDPSRTANEVTMLKFVQNFNYTNGPLTIGTYSYVEQCFYGGASSGSAPMDRKVYLAPNGSYAIGKNIQATMWVDWLQYLHTRGDAGLMPTNYPWDIEPGVNFDITPNLSFNPYVNVYPGSATLASTYIGFVLIGKAI